MILLIIVTSCAMALFTNRPFALAPGLGSVGIIASMITNEGVSMPIARGEFLTVKDGEILSELALPVCGLLSEKSIEENGLALKAVRKSLVDLGYVHNNPIMSVGTLGLPVSPALKLTDRGLVDVKKGEIVPLIVSEKK